MVNAAAIAEPLGVSARTIRRAAAAGAIPSTRIGRRHLFELSVVDVVKLVGLPGRREMEEAASKSAAPHWCGVHRCDAQQCRCAGPTGGNGQ